MQNPQMMNNQMKINQNCMPNQYQIQRPPRMTMPMSNYQNMGQQFRGNPGMYIRKLYIQTKDFSVNNMAMSNVGQMNGQNINMMMTNGPNMAPMNSNQQTNMQQQRMGQVLIPFFVILHNIIISRWYNLNKSIDLDEHGR